jgi:hypothetical protein
MPVLIFIVCFIIATTAASLTILYFVRKEISSTRREVIHLYAELKQDLSGQLFEIEIIKRRINKRNVTLGEVLEEPWVQDLLEEE